ncbi:MAG: glycosyltransferase [Bacteroidia bacterium]|nr:glycosyltransferase [Bacteroidia bacterium]
MKKKILFIAAHRPNRVPGQRFRYEQYLSALEEDGFDYELSFIVSKRDDKILYKPGNYIWKFWFALKAYLFRIKELFTLGQYDIIFIYREALLTRSVFFEKMYHKSKAKLIYDFDDAIWVHDVSDANKNLGWLKNPGKYSKIMSLCDIVFAGNEYLASYAKQFNPNVKIVPTTIDTDYHVGSERIANPICIGWTGSLTTLKYFESLLPCLIELKKQCADKLTFKVIVDVEKEYPELGISTTPWSLDTEISELNKIDIGIMPLPDDDWSNGKCGFKGLQYMSLSKATIMSPVGVNNQIINDGVNGLLAKGNNEWKKALVSLIENPELRKKIGTEARKTIENQYSLNSNKVAYIKYFNELIN